LHCKHIYTPRQKPSEATNKNTFGRAPEEAAHIIDQLGGNAELARKIDITSQAISYWRRKGIPKVWLHVLRSKHKSAFPAPVKAVKPKPQQPSCTNPCGRCGHQCTPVVDQQNDNSTAENTSENQNIA
jgi:hypothetical protein